MSNLVPVFQGQISQDGTLCLNEKHRFVLYLKNLTGKQVNVTVEPLKMMRSNNQNRYLWGVCYKLIADHTGADPEEVHTALKFHFAPKRVIGNLVAPASTARLDTVDFELYLDKVRRWAQEELNINIPMPKDVKSE